MKSENSALRSSIQNMLSRSETVERQVKDLEHDNADLKTQLEELERVLDELKASEDKLKASVETLNDKLKDDSDDALKAVIAQVDQLKAITEQEIKVITSKIKTLETNLKQSPKFGIFSYLNEEEQPLFIEAVDRAVLQEKTFAKINDYLSENLPPALDKVLKEHPSLTKTYIKNFKKD